MRRLIIAGIAGFSLLSTCAAQFRPCKFAEASTIDHKQGITVRRVAVIEPQGEVGASVFVPDNSRALPGIVFSHSALRGPGHTSDLAHFAWALARAGAASIVLDGVLDWQVPNDNSARDPHLMACAGQWLLLHARLDPQRLAVAGPAGGWGGGETPFCLTGESPCWKPRARLNFGQTSPAEFQNTEAMLTAQGQVELARAVQRWLELAEIKAEWLGVAARGD
jgi:hypothetical protein